MKLSIILVAVVIICGCKPSDQSSSSLASATNQPILFDQLLAREDIARRLKVAEQDLASDEWRTNERSGRFNYSRFQRLGPITQDVLHAVKPELEKMTASELITQFKTLPPRSAGTGVDSATAAYFVYEKGNHEITELLKGRSGSELESLRKFEDDKREVFDGPDGANFSVGDIVRYQLLKE